LRILLTDYSYSLFPKNLLNKNITQSIVHYGCEKFAVIRPLTEVSEVAVLGDRLRLALVERLPNGKIVEVSIGVASWV